MRGGPKFDHFWPMGILLGGTENFGVWREGDTFFECGTEILRLLEEEGTFLEGTGLVGGR